MTLCIAGNEFAINSLEDAAPMLSALMSMCQQNFGLRVFDENGTEIAVQLALTAGGIQ